MVKNENESGRRFVGRWLRIVICVSLVFIFQFPFLNSISAQNYSSNDTVTEYPNKCTYYHDKFEGRKTASGEIFDQNAFTAAHWRIKLGTYILVTNQNTGLQVIVKVNDRCPKHGVIDLSHRAATAIGIRGCQPVTVRLLPEGYEELCAAQDKVFDSVRSRLHGAVGVEPKTGSDNATKPQPKTGVGQELPTQQPAITSNAYNLILCNVSSHGEAYSNMQKLPQKYREKAIVEPLGDSNDLRVSLDVRLPHSQAVELRRTLISKFPKATLTPVP